MKNELINAIHAMKDAKELIEEIGIYDYVYDNLVLCIDDCQKALKKYNSERFHNYETIDLKINLGENNEF